MGASEASRDRLAISSGRLYGAVEARYLNTAIVEAYRSGGYTLQEVVEYFGLHDALVSRIVSVNTQYKN